MSTAGPLALIDHHCHGAVSAPLYAAGFEALLTEAPGPPPPGTSMFDSQLGFAVRRWCAPLLDLEPSAPADDYLRRRVADAAWSAGDAARVAELAGSGNARRVYGL